MSVLIILIVLIALYCIWGLLLTKFGLRGLQCTRHFSKQAVFCGDDGELVEVGATIARC